jgi:hypothetical protein
MKGLLVTSGCPVFSCCTGSAGVEERAGLAVFSEAPGAADESEVVDAGTSDLLTVPLVSGFAFRTTGAPARMAFKGIAATFVGALLCLLPVGELAAQEWSPLETEVSVLAGPLRNGDYQALAVMLRLRQTLLRSVFVEGEVTTRDPRVGGGCPGAEEVLCQLSDQLRYMSVGMGVQRAFWRARPYAGPSIGRRTAGPASGFARSLFMGSALQAESPRVRLYAEYRRRWGPETTGDRQWAFGLSLRTF